MATCEGCKFHHQTECRRYPPQVTLMRVDYEVNRYGDRGNSEYVGTQAWPNVEPMDWCGEWKPMPLPPMVYDSGIGD